jgi:thioesterase domain-containing protein
MKVLLPQCELQLTEGSGALIELKPGGSRNFFLVHDGDGDTLLYLSLARRMPDDLAVFGIEPRTVAGVPLAHTSIEDMAGFYVKEMRKKQPHGPYLLGGLCAGGVIAYEMASQLLRAGESVELVAVLEAATPQAPKRRWTNANQRIDRLTQVLTDARNSERATIVKACSVVGAILRKLVHSLAWEIMQRGDRLWGRARFHLLHQLLARQLPWPGYVPELSVRQIYGFAEARYVPKPLCGAPAVLVRARRRSFVLSDTPYGAIYADETLGWGALIQDLALVDVDGGHGTMLQEPFVRSLAAALLLHINHKPEPVSSQPNLNLHSQNDAQSSATVTSIQIEPAGELESLSAD